MLCRASMPPSAPGPALEEPPAPAGGWLQGKAAQSHLLPLMSGSMEIPWKGSSEHFPVAPGHLALSTTASRGAQQPLSALRVHEPSPCHREPRLRQEERPVDVNCWELCWLPSVAQKPPGSVLPPALVLLQAMLVGKESLGSVCAEKSPWLCAS